jgi:hypothetical protein
VKPTPFNERVSEDEYWASNPKLRDLALLAAATGQSLDQLYFASTSRIFAANSNGSWFHLPRMR